MKCEQMHDVLLSTLKSPDVPYYNEYYKYRTLSNKLYLCNHSNNSRQAHESLH